MAEGLRLLGQCPRCGGALSFGDELSAPPMAAAAPEDAAALAPHLVLGLPQRH
jgi:hypothetical protein